MQSIERRRTHEFEASASCRNRMAADKPAGPPPTITTSYSIDSLSLHQQQTKKREEGIGRRASE
jgi:hypothetical protein